MKKQMSFLTENATCEIFINHAFKFFQLLQKNSGGGLLLFLGEKEGAIEKSAAVRAKLSSGGPAQVRQMPRPTHPT